MRDRAVPEGGSGLPGDEAEGGDPLRRPGLACHEEGSPRAPQPIFDFRRAGARHLLRPDDHGRAARRHGRGRPSPRIRPRRCRGQGESALFDGVWRRRREASGLDEPWRPHHPDAAGLCGGRRVAERAVRGDRGREAQILRPDVPPRGGAYARRRQADPQFRPQGRRADRRLDHARLPRGGDREDPRRRSARAR